MTAAPARQIAAPRMSQRSGRTPSTAYSQASDERIRPIRNLPPPHLLQKE
jgi:hypothetical protein